MGKQQGGNSKKEAGNARKAASQAEKASKTAAAKAAKEDQDWAVGSKGPSAKKLADEEKKVESQTNTKAEAAKKKAEAAAQLAAEDAENAKKRPVMRQDKKAAKQEFKINSFASPSDPVDSFSARGIDAALELLDVVEKPDVPKSSDKLDRHPER
ncbi:hypothetical protein HDU91_000091 [Kappamyces sp. JEL0680]|nr:hypothetical protein HDU91_000091 [Kappamyces sp. JEL0680]